MKLMCMDGSYLDSSKILCRLVSELKGVSHIVIWDRGAISIDGQGVGFDHCWTTIGDCRNGL